MGANEVEKLVDISSMDNNKQNIPEAIETAKRKLSDDKQANADTSAINKRKKSEDNQDAVSEDKETVKTEAPDEIESASSSIKVTIKEEPVDEHDDSPTADVSDNATISTSSNHCYNAATIAIKKEPTQDDISANMDKDHAGSPAVEVSDIAPASTSLNSLTIPIKKESTNDDTSVMTDAVSSSAVIVKTEPNTSTQAVIADSSVSSSTLRPSCRFGIKCYRRNPAHRSSEAHPGDSDYRRPSFPIPPLGTPACPFGNSCYRRNPIHFQQHSHPSDYEPSDLESDEEDPFYEQGDSDLDYKPGAEIDDDEDDDDLEFNSERQNCDEYD
ncbi:hypothetical protein AWZ03_003557 [Drosophila navojoa]|uniref:PBZ-type domain-containing protein n=1 Tax=Drosophila navojoa TaxID=7232 RepID=A0A484BMN0_DRONA|nr:hypothetical protein AWZ03_003557 [Drosophila navojoa]